MSRLSKVCLAFVMCWVLSSVSLPPGATASTVETFVYAAGGQSMPAFPNPPPFACATFSAPAPVALDGFFRTALVTTPTEGLGPCSIAGDFRQNTARVGPLSDTISLITTFNSGDNSFSGSASANAQYGKVGAKAHGEFTGPANGFIVDGAAAFGMFRETGMRPNTNADTIRF